MSEPSITRYMLTTFDNPYNPFTHFDEWYSWDVAAGYNTSSFLARIAVLSSDMSEPDQELSIQTAIDEIVKENVTGMHRKVSENSFNV